MNNSREKGEDCAESTSKIFTLKSTGLILNILIVVIATFSLPETSLLIPETQNS